MKILLLNFLVSSVALACKNIPANFISGCNFDFLNLVNPSTGFVIAEQNCGLEVDRTTFLEQPFVFYDEALDFMKYTLFMIDNDNPLSPDGKTYLHWLVTDIDGNSLKYGLGTYAGFTLAGKRIRSLPSEILKIYF